MIRFHDVTKKFPDGTVALDTVNFQCDDGEFVFIVGSSGAGKTTLLRLILRDYVANSGNVFVDEKDVSKLKSSEVTLLRRKIGFIFQDLKLLADRNLFENVALSMEVLGRPAGEINEEVNRALKLVGLAGQEKMFPSQMSGGELQRVAIARAIVGSPKYLLADEPTGNIDPANSWAIIKILEDVNKSGTTVIMATHNSEIVDSLGKRVIRIDNGRIISDKPGGKYHA